MNVPLGFAMATTGLLITTAGVVGANVVLFRYLARLSNRQSTRGSKSAAFECVFWLLVWAALGVAGLTFLLLGLVVTGGLVTWAPLLPIAMLVLMIPTAWYARWRQRGSLNGTSPPH